MSHPPSRPQLFGTDGIRAAFGDYPLDRPTVTALGRQLAAMLAAERPASTLPLVMLGGDTRDSTPEICRWLAAGLQEGGARWRYAGVVPTPAVARLVPARRAAAGIAVSASHNPHPDNGIKLLDPRGFKWSEAAEAQLEALLGAAGNGARPAGGEPSLEPDPSLATAYLDALAATLPPGQPLAGLRVALDTGNGAASPHAAELFGRLGAEVELIHAAPDGTNINRDCGSTAPAELARITAGRGCDLGFAFDGDADRAILADERGQVHDGDAMLYLWATALAAAGELQPAAIVATSMSNLGLARALARHGIEVVRCDVGDRQVVETMRRERLRLGGEQSGHLVDLTLSSTGDGLLTALQVAHLVASQRQRTRGATLSQQLAGFRRYPQVLLNVRVQRKPELGSIPQIATAARAVESALGDDGRLVLRYSGTEPLARVMIEGPDQERVNALAEELAEVIRRQLG